MATKEAVKKRPAVGSYTIDAVAKVQAQIGDEDNVRITAEQLSMAARVAVREAMEKVPKSMADAKITIAIRFEVEVVR